MTANLRFGRIEPVADHGLGGLVRDHFGNGRIFATVGAHGGLLGIGYWGRQHVGVPPQFFRGDGESAWVKLFRVRVRIGKVSHYLTLNDTHLYPFGYASRCTIAGVTFTHELLLLPDALVQRARVIRNPRRLPIQFEMVHQEACTAVSADNRTWGEFSFRPEYNALIAGCRDQNPVQHMDEALAQKGLKLPKPDAPDATTWIGVGCDSRLHVRRGYHRRSKYYLAGDPARSREVAYFTTFATSKPALQQRLKTLRKSVHRESDALLANYAARLRGRPQIDVGDPVLNSAFGQYPELIHAVKVHDRPGAARATVAGYFVWGWDGMTPMIPCALANEPAYTADVLRFMKDSWRPDFGIPLAFTTAFTLRLKEPFPAQCQYIASLYHYVAATGDLAVAREMFPMCVKLLERCRRDVVRDTGLVAGNALWPDFPEAMDEDGHDVSSLNNSLVYQGLRGMEYLARALGRAKLADDYREWAGRLRASFVKYLYDQKHGYFISSCSSRTLKPRKHYCGQAVFWITPFARELVAHAPGRIADFMQKHLRTDKCMLTLPRWDRAWMADGNQLGSSFPTADYFYLNVHKLVAKPRALTSWLDDVDWFWRHHTAPEAFTPEAENEAALGPDNPGCKQLQAVTCWYASLYLGLAGMDIDHEGLTLTPWGDRPIDIGGLKLNGATIDLRIRGSGAHVGSLTLNGRRLPAGTRKIAWSQLRGGRARVALTRTEKAPSHPVIVRADGLRVVSVVTDRDSLTARVTGTMSGELAVQAPHRAQVRVGGKPVRCTYDAATRTITIPNLGVDAGAVTVRVA